MEQSEYDPEDSFVSVLKGLVEGDRIAVSEVVLLKPLATQSLAEVDRGNAR